MVDEKPKEEKPTGDKQETLLDANVALVLAENKSLKETVVEKDALIEDLTKKLKQATDLIEEDTKSRIIADIKPKTTLPGEYLSKMSVEKLREMQKTLDQAVAPVFKSGTPMGDTKKKATLDGMFEGFAKSTWRKE